MSFITSLLVIFFLLPSGEIRVASAASHRRSNLASAVNVIAATATRHPGSDF
jgi:hypothetical protein